MTDRNSDRAYRTSGGPFSVKISKNIHSSKIASPVGNPETPLRENPSFDRMGNFEACICFPLQMEKVLI